MGQEENELPLCKALFASALKISQHHIVPQLFLRGQVLSHGDTVKGVPYAAGPTGEQAAGFLFVCPLSSCDPGWEACC